MVLIFCDWYVLEGLTAKFATRPTGLSAAELLLAASEIKLDYNDFCWPCTFLWFLQPTLQLALIIFSIIRNQPRSQWLSVSVEFDQIYNQSCTFQKSVGYKFDQKCWKRHFSQCFSFWYFLTKKIMSQNRASLAETYSQSLNNNNFFLVVVDRHRKNFKIKKVEICSLWATSWFHVDELFYRIFSTIKVGCSFDKK